MKLTITDKIFVPVSVKDELPNYNGNYFVKRQSKVSDKEVQYICEEIPLVFDEKVTHWLKKETNKYVLSKEELIEFTKNIIFHCDYKFYEERGIDKINSIL